jgi:hypothetical protein
MSRTSLQCDLSILGGSLCLYFFCEFPLLLNLCIPLLLRLYLSQSPPLPLLFLQHLLHSLHFLPPPRLFLLSLLICLYLQQSLLHVEFTRSETIFELLHILVVIDCVEDKLSFEDLILVLEVTQS